MKKLLSLALAVVMILSLGATAFAAPTLTPDTQAVADDGSGNLTGTIEFEGGLNLPTIDVTIPATGQLFVNPYQMETVINADPTGATKTEDSVFSVIYGIESKTAAALDVKVMGTVSPNGDVNIVEAPLTAPAAGSLPEKDVFVYIEVDSAGTKAGSGNNTYYTGTFGPYMGADNTLILTEDEADVAVTLGTIANADLDGNGTVDPNAQTPELAKYATFRFGGEAHSETAEPWTSNDTVSASVVFSFVPHVKNNVAAMYISAEGKADAANTGSKGSATAVIDHDAGTVIITIPADAKNNDKFTFSARYANGATGKSTAATPAPISLSAGITVKGTSSGADFDTPTFGTDDKVVVTSENGEVTKTYTITVNKASS